MKEKMEHNEYDARKVFISEDNEENRKKAEESFKEAVLYAEELKKKYEGNLFKQYPDVIFIHRDLSDEELEELIERGIEEGKKMKEWPLI